jgi:peptide/nickel transport system ATP-binding protein
MSEVLLEVKNLEVRYKTDLDTVFAVNDISFSLNKGETLGIVGETGAGKTTTALTVLKLLPERVGQIKGGSIRFQGEEILELSEPEMRKIRGEKISMIFQDPMTSLNPVHTVGNQIAEALKLHNDDKRSNEQIEARVDEVLEMVGIPPSRKHDYPHQFSGGMKQRVVIAIALACEPDLLIADEPTTALDVTIQAQVLLLMRELKERLNTAMLLITHDLGVIAQMCDRVAVMYAGEIIEIGTLEDIFLTKEHHPYTVGLFGSIPKIDDESKSLLHPIEGLMPDPTNLPVGCRFLPRCPHAIEQCKNVQCENWLTDTHAIRCLLWKGED